MKTKKLISAVLLTCLCLSVFAQRDWTPLAKEIVENAGIQPGEVVVVNAGQHNIPLLEAIVMESNIKGAFTNVFFTTDEIERSLAHDVNYQYLLTTPTYFGEWVKNIDVWIGLVSGRKSSNNIQRRIRSTDGSITSRRATTI